MLAGSTFAWFTDTATTGVNQIKSGTLDVELWQNEGTKENQKWAKVEDGSDPLNWVTKDGRAQDQIFWEPGCTYELPQLKIVNNGNLALKYKIQINGIQGDAKLNQVIDWTMTMDDATTVLGTEHHLAAKTGETVDADILTISGQMKKEAGNEYQNLTIDGIAITVYATQDTVENDSYGPTYDKNATYYPVLDAAGLKDALVNGGNIKVDDDVAVAPVVEDPTENTLVPQMTLTKDTTLDLSGNKISVQHDATTNFGKASPVLMAVMDGTLTIEGNGEINCEAGTQQVYGINVNGGNVVVNGGKFYGAITAIQVQKGSLVINGGFFDMAPTCKAQVPQYAKYIINCIDANYKNGSAKIIVKGGTFVNFDPSANPEGAGTTYVADGYSVICEEQANGDKWYTVVEGKGASSETELNDIISSATEPTTITLTAGTYELPSLENKDITIKGTKDTVIDLTDKVKKANSVTFEGVTVNFGKNNYKGFQHTSPVAYKDCTINGFMTTYGDTTFENCTFNAENDKYSINFYGGENFTLTNCHFYGVNKNVYIYQETVDCDKKVTFDNCDFHMSAADDLKSAVMLNAPVNYSGHKYIVVMNDCTAEGTNTTAAENLAGNTNYQGLYGLKHKDGNGNAKMIEGTVTINGETVYTH